VGIVSVCSIREISEKLYCPKHKGWDDIRRDGYCKDHEYTALIQRLMKNVLAYER
jgi:hypothetical protein